jgi:hypothetical protein
MFEESPRRKETSRLRDYPSLRYQGATRMKKYIVPFFEFHTSSDEDENDGEEEE